MIDLYTFGTPNGKKASICLEEMSLEYNVHPINIMNDEQFDPAFLKISPNNKIPAIHDHDTNTSLMETGAILLYLAKKTGKFVHEDTADYWQVMQWLMWQMGGFGPMLGQAHHFITFNQGVSDYAEKRYGDEAKRLYSVLETRLDGRDFVAGEYSIADMAIFPWAARFGWQNIDLHQYPHVLAWYKRVAERDAVQKGYGVPNPEDIPMP